MRGGRTLKAIVEASVNARPEWVKASDLIRTIEAGTLRQRLPAGVPISSNTVRQSLMRLHREKKIQRRGTRHISEWAPLGVAGVEDVGHLASPRGELPAGDPGHTFSLRVDTPTLEILERWSRLVGVRLQTLIKNTAIHEALRWIVATQNVPMRLTPGVPVFRTKRAQVAPTGVGLEYGIEFMASGDERVWVTDLVENLPPAVAPDGKGFVIDIVGHPVVNLLVRSGGVIFPAAHRLGTERHLTPEMVSTQVSTSRKIPEVPLVGIVDVRSVRSWRSPKSRSPTTPSAAGSSSSASPPRPPDGTTATSPSPAPPSTPGSTTSTGAG